jgi:hypothetical protein
MLSRGDLKEKHIIQLKIKKLVSLEMGESCGTAGHGDGWVPPWPSEIILRKHLT